MIGETLIDLGFGIFRLLFGAFEMIGLPYQFMSVLESILAYGNWVVGVDIMILFVGSVVFWWGVHLSIGLAIWLWNQLPLT